MIKKTGSVQMVFTPEKTLQVDKSNDIPEMKYMAKEFEKNRTAKFKGLWELFRKLITAYKSGCDKVYIFFDKVSIK